MSSMFEALSLLNDLSSDDRQWVIGKLSPQERARLLAPQAEPVVAQAMMPVEVGAAGSIAATESLANGARPMHSQERLWDCDVQSLVDLLRTEPVWVAAALLAADQWPWAEQLLDAVPKGARMEIERIRNECEFTHELKDVVVHQVSQRITTRNVQRAPSKFEALVQRLAASRSKRRLAHGL